MFILLLLDHSDHPTLEYLAIDFFVCANQSVVLPDPLPCLTSAVDSNTLLIALVGFDTDEHQIPLHQGKLNSETGIHI